MKDIAFREQELNYWSAHFPDASVVRWADTGHFVADEKAADLNVEMEKVLS